MNALLPLRWLGLLALCCPLSVACPPSPDAPLDGEEGEGDGPLVLQGQPTGPSVTAAVSATDGAVLTLETPSRTWTLDVGTDALGEDTVITMEEITLPELPGAVAMRFSPDGLQFLVPAILLVDEVIDAGPDGALVGLAFTEGVAGVETQFVAPEGQGGASMLIEHFSAAAITDAASAADAVDAVARVEQAALSRQEGFAVGLLRHFEDRIAIDIERAHFGATPFETAARVVLRFRSAVSEKAVGELTGGGPTTLDELGVQGLASVRDKGAELFAARTVPGCTRGRDVIDLIDFAEVVQRINATFQLLGSKAPTGTLCVTAVLTAEATPAALASDVDEVTVNAVLELVGFDGTRQEIGPSSIEFEAAGASGPTTVLTATGVVPAQRFVRPPTRPRPPAVQVVVTGDSVDIQTEVLPPPTPVVVALQEPVTATIAATPEALSAPGAVEVCAAAAVGGAAAERFAVDWSLPGGVGALTATQSVTTTGTSCVTWFSPETQPATDVTATVLATINIDGAIVAVSAIIQLAAASPCVVGGAGSSLPPNESFIRTLATGLIVSDGTAIDRLTDEGTETASVSRTETAYAFSVAARASSSLPLVSLSVDSSGDEGLSLAVTGEAEKQDQIMVLSGRGTGLARLVFVVSGEIGSEGSMSFQGAFDPDDSVGGDAESLFFGGGSGPRRVEEVVIVEQAFSYNLPTAKRLYSSMLLSGTNEVSVTARLVSASVSLGSCSP